LNNVLGVGTDHGDNISYNCPFCEGKGKSEDTEEKLWVNLEKLVFICYRCETQGSLKYLFTRLNLTIEDSVRLKDFYSRIASLRGIEVKEEVEPASTDVIVDDYVPHLMEERCIPVSTDSPGWGYLRSRGLSKEDLDFYQFAEGGERGRYRNRVIVPTFDFTESKVKFFVARAYLPVFFYKKGVKKEAPKYLNPRGKNRSLTLFNLWKALDVSSTEIVITEGVFSAIGAGKNAVATYGKLVADTQVNLLAKNIGSREAIVALDGDAHEQALELCGRLKLAGVNVVSMVTLPYGEDPDSLRSVFSRYVAERTPADDISMLKLRTSGALCVGKPHSQHTTLPVNVESLHTKILNIISRNK